MKTETAFKKSLDYLIGRFVNNAGINPILHDTRHMNQALITSMEKSMAPAAKSHHHNFPGGLIIHTAEVACASVDLLCMDKNRRGVSSSDYGILSTAALWHDAAKVNEYILKGRTEDGGYDYETTPYKNKIYHVAGSYGAFMYACGKYNVTFSPLEILEIGHCMLSHHGPRRDWGSCVEPQTDLAKMLHYADNLSIIHGYSSEGRDTHFFMYGD